MVVCVKTAAYAEFLCFVPTPQKHTGLKTPQDTVTPWTGSIKKPEQSNQGTNEKG